MSVLHRRGSLRGPHGALFRRLARWLRTDPYTRCLPIEIWLVGTDSNELDSFLTVVPEFDETGIDTILDVSLNDEFDGRRLRPDYRRIVLVSDLLSEYEAEAATYDIDQPDLWASLTEHILDALHRRFPPDSRIPLKS
jgi:hypothetical protein